ncbi:NTP transferase domain-containing protein [bacterium]|nr:NTP transferase domain-containing protein [bacterium]
MKINSPFPQEGWVAVILAGGKGTRMSSERNKVCHSVGGIPVINRTIATLKNCGFPNILVVVGHKYKEVITTVEKEFKDVNFVLQEEPKGTGHAVKCACSYLQTINFQGNLLIIAGDKIVEGESLMAMREEFEKGGYDLLLATCLSEGKSFGRIIRDEAGKVMAILESKGREKDFPPTGETNQSIYMFKASPLYEALPLIKQDPHSGEEQVTDVVSLFYEKGLSIGTFIVDKEKILTFNTPEELSEIEGKVGKVQFIEKKENLLNERSLKPAREWLSIFYGDEIKSVLKGIYGNEAWLWERRRRDFQRLLEEFIKAMGEDALVFLVRSPAKLNILGRHIDHRGGMINSISIDREILMVVHPREDDIVHLVNSDESYPPRSFSISEEFAKYRWLDWAELINLPDLKNEIAQSKGDWVNYAKASVLMLQERFRDRLFKGFDALVFGDIPVGSGLSSSSALVVAFAEASCLINGLKIPEERFVHLCGEGEWFVQTRGGMGDHAGIKFGSPFCVNQFSFHPFSYVQSVPLPKGYAILYAYSHQKAQKAGWARDTFNQRIAAYEIGTRLLKREIEIEHLRDLHPEEKGLSDEEIFRLLKALPISMRKEDVLRELGEEGEEVLERCNADHLDVFPVRGVCLFGIAECARSRICPELLKNGDIHSLAELINISHDGDRVKRLNEKGEMVPHKNDVSDEYLDKLIKMRGEYPERKEFTLAYQPGDYACSTPEIDYMVDLARRVKGVLGAQILGAGLGGSIMILAEEEAVADVERALIEGYYEPRGLEPRMGRCVPIKGAGIINI